MLFDKAPLFAEMLNSSSEDDYLLKILCQKQETDSKFNQAVFNALKKCRQETEKLKKQVEELDLIVKKQHLKNPSLTASGHEHALDSPGSLSQKQTIPKVSHMQPGPLSTLNDYCERYPFHTKPPLSVSKQSTSSNIVQSLFSQNSGQAILAPGQLSSHNSSSNSHPHQSLISALRENDISMARSSLPLLLSERLVSNSSSSVSAAFPVEHHMIPSNYHNSFTSAAQFSHSSSVNHYNPHVSKLSQECSPSSVISLQSSSHAARQPPSLSLLSLAAVTQASSSTIRAVPHVSSSSENPPVSAFDKSEDFNPFFDLLPKHNATYSEDLNPTASKVPPSFTPLQASPIPVMGTSSDLNELTMSSAIECVPEPEEVKRRLKYNSVEPKNIEKINMDRVAEAVDSDDSSDSPICSELSDGSESYDYSCGEDYFGNDSDEEWDKSYCESVSDSDELASIASSVSSSRSSTERFCEKLLETDKNAENCISSVPLKGENSANKHSSNIRKDGSNSSPYTSAEESLGYIEGKEKEFREKYLFRTAEVSDKNDDTVKNEENTRKLIEDEDIENTHSSNIRKDGSNSAYTFAEESLGYSEGKEKEFREKYLLRTAEVSGEDADVVKNAENTKKLIEDKDTENTQSSNIRKDGCNSSSYTSAEESLGYTEGKEKESRKKYLFKTAEVSCKNEDAVKNEETTRKLREDEDTENTHSGNVKKDGSNSSLYTSAEESFGYTKGKEKEFRKKYLFRPTEVFDKNDDVVKIEENTRKLIEDEDKLLGINRNVENSKFMKEYVTPAEDSYKIFISKQKKHSSQNISSLETGENLKQPSSVNKYLKFVEDAILKGCTNVGEFMKPINDAVQSEIIEQEHQMFLRDNAFFFNEESGLTDYVMDLGKFMKFVETTSSHMNHPDCDLFREKIAEANCEIEAENLQLQQFLLRESWMPFLNKRRMLSTMSCHDYHKLLDASSIENLRKCIILQRSVHVLSLLPLADILTCAVVCSINPDCIWVN